MGDLAGKKTAYYGFTGIIEPGSATRIASAFNLAVNSGCDEVYLCLSSTGGLIADGIYLYNHIRSNASSKGNYSSISVPSRPSRQRYM